MIIVVLVDDHAMFRTGVRAELEGGGQQQRPRAEQPGDAPGAVTVVGEAADAPEAVRVILDTRPDVVLLDVHLPGGGGVEVLRRVHAAAPEVRFLALSVSDTAEDVIGT